MLVQQFIYTKVPPERSPWKKTGFHMVLYPTAHLSKKDVLEIESKLHYPGQGVFVAKRVVFYQKTQAGLELGIVFLRSLESKDEFGREGVFLAHGFLVPEPLALQVLNPDALADILEPHAATDVDAVLGLGLADFTTGNLAPLEIAEETLDQLRSAILPTLTDAEKKLIPALYSLATEGTNQDAVVLQGAPEAVSKALGHCLAWFPAELRIKLSYDSGFDGGKLFFFPIKLVGYSKQLPATGDPLRFDLASARFDPNERLQRFTQPNSFYSRWVQREKEPFASGNLTAVYQLAGFLEGRTRELPDPLIVPKAFVEASMQDIGHTFETRAAEQLDAGWIKLYIEQETPDELLRLLLDNLAAGKFAQRLTQLILQRHITPAQQKRALPETFVRAGGALLAALMRIWERGKLLPEDLQPLPAEDRERVLVYLMGTPYAAQPWCLQLLRDEPKKLARLAANPETEAAVLQWLTEQFTGAYQPVGDLLALEMLQSAQLAALASPADWPALLEQRLVREGWTEKQAKRLVAAAKAIHPDPAHQPVLAALAQVPGQLPPAISDNHLLRRAYLGVLITQHTQTPQALAHLGYTPEETASIQPGGGLIGHLKKLLGF